MSEKNNLNVIFARLDAAKMGRAEEVKRRKEAERAAQEAARAEKKDARSVTEKYAAYMEDAAPAVNDTAPAAMSETAAQVLTELFDAPKPEEAVKPTAATPFDSEASMKPVELSVETAPAAVPTSEDVPLPVVQLEEPVVLLQEPVAVSDVPEVAENETAEETPDEISADVAVLDVVDLVTPAEVEPEPIAEMEPEQPMIEAVTEEAAPVEAISVENVIPTQEPAAPVSVKPNPLDVIAQIDEAMKAAKKDLAPVEQETYPEQMTSEGEMAVESETSVEAVDIEQQVEETEAAVSDMHEEEHTESRDEEEAVYVELRSDRDSQFRPAIESADVFAAQVFLAHRYNEDKKVGAYAIAVNMGEKKYLASLGGHTADAYEYGFAGAIAAFEYAMANNIREVTVFTEPELADVLQQNVNALMFGYSATRRKYVEVAQNALRNIYIEFDVRKVSNELADLALTMAQYQASNI